MDSGGPQQRKCQLCSLYKSNASNESTICRHQTRTKYLRFPMIGATNRCGAEQKSFDEARYYANDGLYYSNRKINKSLSSITDSFGGGGAGITSNVFGERIFTSKNHHRPNTLVVNENATRRTTSKGTIESSSSSSSYSRQLSVPNTTSELSHFNDFATTPGNAIPTSISCDICGVCNQNRCQAAVNCDGSRFTVTTLSRSGTLTLGNSNKFQTLPRNGGVFIAVKDWSSSASSPSSSGYSGPQTATMQDNYYEILKNPNNNQPYENHAIIAAAKEKADQSSSSSSSSGEPIYAVVNKLNKTKNKLQQQQSEPKFSYGGGTQQIVGVGNKSDSALYASIAAVNNNSRLPSLDNNGSSCNIKTSHITITSSDDQPGSDTSEIYAKVWKGPRKSLDSQKMYVFLF